MGIYTEGFAIDFRPAADERAMVLGRDVRFTVLTSRLLRMEFSPTAEFEDRPSQAFWYREQVVPAYEVRRLDGLIEIETEALVLRYKENDGGFSAYSLGVLLKESGVSWRYGHKNPLNLKGTARTLDDIDGVINLEDGLVSRSGWSLWDDTEQLLFTDDGWLRPRDGHEGYQDLYFFGYGQDYYGCLRDFCKIAGPAPVIPRWALGNWWSRYWAYSADELLALMDAFRDHQVPLSVCIVDMDWHIVDTGNACSGWTGYTWNRELFPDPPTFIKALHERGLKTALNLHPAEGIHGHEAQYNRMAEAMGVDPESKEPIPFAIDDPQFTEVYFEALHHPYEAEGIDFWWLDWQQGTMSGLPGLDPLWWLNHLHFYDLARNGDKRPFIFSRWGGLGNHRYPIGFSGDTHVSWESLQFQPFFTATAANVNYGWWSHDIGGHMYGVEDGELYARWVQYGVFSPILRLHSTNNPFHERRPWGYDSEIERVSSNALRLRHRLVPYLQSMSWRNHIESVPLTRPMYYEHPADEQAYHCRDQYLFGSELIAAPFISASDPDTRLCRQVVWLPAGDWFDFFSGVGIPGNGWQAIYGGLDQIPVFARAGAIVPLANEDTGVGDGRSCTEIHVFPGMTRSFELIDGDDNTSGHRARISQNWGEGEWRVQIEIAGGPDLEAEAREHQIAFRGLEPEFEVQIEGDGQISQVEHDYEAGTKTAMTRPFTVRAGSRVVVVLTGDGVSLNGVSGDLEQRCEKMLQSMRMNSSIKLKLATQLAQIIEDPSKLAAYQMALTESQMQALAEQVSGCGAHKAATYIGTEEEIILWNNDGSDVVLMTFSAEDIGGLAHFEKGQLPEFGVVAIRENGVTYQSGNQPFQGRQSIKNWFDQLVERIPLSQVEDVEAIVQFDISGDNGCQMTLELMRGEIRLNEGRNEHSSVTITATSQAWLALINGDQQVEMMFMAGDLQIGGSFEQIAGLVDAFSFSPPGAYLGEHWRLDVNYMDAFTRRFGTK